MKIWSVCTVLLIATQAADAGGMLLPVRGVRALSRAGALTAGADDADALWLDPAGLAHVHGTGTKAFLFDVAYVYHPVDITPVDSAGIPQPLVSNHQPGRTPIPTLAAALALDDRFTIGGGITTPYAGAHRFAADGPERYASVSLADATFAVVTFGAAYRITDSFRIGATVQDVVSKVTSEVVVSMCPGTCAPDDRTYDSLMRVDQNDYISPSGSVGMQLDLGRAITLGVAAQGPARIASSGTLTLSLPSSLQFEGATVRGSSVSLGFTLPPVVRTGIELRPLPGLRVEAALEAELWSFHDEIAIDPDRIRIENAQGINAYNMHAMRIPRDYKTSWSPALGAEYRRGDVMVGAGIAYETAAAPTGKVSALTVDNRKLLVGLGGGYAAEGWQIGAAAGYVAVDDVDVPVGEGRVFQLQPLKDDPQPVVVNAGHYSSSYVVVGVRAARLF